MVLSSFLAGDFPGDFTGVLAATAAGGLASGLAGDLAGVFWASVLGPEAAVADSGDKVEAFIVSAAAGAAAGLGAARASSSSLGLTTRILTLPVTCLRIKAA